MIIYTVFLDSPECHFATLREALKAAREEAIGADYDYDIEITRHEVVPITKASLLEILNSHGGSYSMASRIVRIIKSRPKKS